MIKKYKRLENQFYNGTYSHAIMNTLHFGKEIEAYLFYEKILVSKILASSNYSFFVELGCGKAKNADKYLMHCPLYYGIDVNKRNIDMAKKQISYNEVRKKILNIEANNFIDNFDFMENPERGLWFFPFNLFGNLDDNLSLLAKILNKNDDILISSFKLNDGSSFCRYKYYFKCGLRNLKKENGNNSILFSSNEGLNSYSYNSNYFYDLLLSYASKKDLVFHFISKKECVGWHLYIKNK